MKEPFLLAMPVLEKIKNAGYEAFFVGGSVRDFLLDRDIHDVDIATSALPEEIKAIFPKTVDVGIEHGTIIVIYNRIGFEVTTFRTESDYKDYRRPDSVTFVRTLREDLKRRDFTMNAIALAPTGELIDPFHGQVALKNKLIETVGSPDERFQEDALRLMRAVRFISQLNFGLEEKTEQALAKYASLLRHIAIERISSEMIKLLDGQNKKKALEVLLSSRLNNYLPSLFNEKQVILNCISYSISSLKEIHMWLLALYIAQEQQPAHELRKWRLPKRKIDFLTKSFSFLKWRFQQEWTPYDLFTAGLDVAILVEEVYRTLHDEAIDNVHALFHHQFCQLAIQSNEQLAISGKDLLEWTGKRGGPWVREILEAVKKAVLNEQLANEKKVIRRWVESCQLL